MSPLWEALKSVPLRKLLTSGELKCALNHHDEQPTGTEVECDRQGYHWGYYTYRNSHIKRIYRCTRCGINQYRIHSRTEST